VGSHLAADTDPLRIRLDRRGKHLVHRVDRLGQIGVRGVKLLGDRRLVLLGKLRDDQVPVLRRPCLVLLSRETCLMNLPERLIRLVESLHRWRDVRPGVVIDALNGKQVLRVQ
jgi:hypothetical protein